MQDEVNTKVVAIMIKGGKISAHLLQHIPKTRGKQFYHLFTPHVVPLLNT